MSWKGIKKATARLPQLVKSKTGLSSDKTIDHDYIELERHFTELEREAKKLNEDAIKFKDATLQLLSAQCLLGGYVSEIYTNKKEITESTSSTSSKEIAETKKITDFNSNGKFSFNEYPQAKSAISEYCKIVTNLKEVISPEIEEVELRVVLPTKELVEILKKVRKMCIKRDHKLLDFDRHRISVKKLREKKERSISEEKSLYKTETLLEQATEEYNFYNDLLKEEFPKLFEFQSQFVEPLFETFYYIQLNVFYVLSEQMQALKDMGYFDIGVDIMIGYEEKKGDIGKQVESLDIVKFGSRGNLERKKSILSGKDGESKGNLNDNERKNVYAPLNERGSKNLSRGTTSIRRVNPSQGFYQHRRSVSEGSLPIHGNDNNNNNNNGEDDVPPPPPYSTKPSGVSMSTMPSQSYNKNGNRLKTPFISPKPGNLGIDKGKGSMFSNSENIAYVCAIYDYEAQAEGDLTFKEGEIIEVIERGDENQWWRGKLGDKEGMFPGNYVKNMK